MVEFCIFISVRTIPLLEFVTRGNSMFKLIDSHQTSYSVVELLPELTSFRERERERETDMLIRFIRFILVKALEKATRRNGLYLYYL